MTVTVRPYPKRTYQNGIRPFRPVVPANNIRPYTLKTWRPPVPEPLPPAPLLGPKQLLALGVLVLVQLWGRLAGRPQTSAPPSPADGDQIAGTMPPSGNTQPGTLTLGVSPYSYDTNIADCTPAYWVRSEPGAPAFWSTDGVTSFRKVNIPAPSCGGFGGSELEYVRYGQTLRRPLVGLASHGYVFWDGTWHLDWDGPGAVPIPAPSVPIPLPPGFEPSPAPEPEPATKPQPQPTRPLPLIPFPAPVPFTTPVPVPAPVTDPSRQPAPAPPVTPLLVPRRTFPIPLREASPTQDGALVPQTPAPVATTAPDAHFPVPGAPPVTGNGPRPTPEGIAQELGRLEQKVARLSNPQTDATGDASDRIGLALKLLGDIVEFFNSITAGGGYVLSSPCEVDEAGNRIPVQVNYAGAPTALGVISNKLDAVAALLQVHKDLKQPICRQTPAVGESVTVQFVQVD